MNRDVPSFYTVHEPAQTGRVVVNVPHAGEAIPDDVRSTIALPDEVLRRDVDLAVDRLCANAPALGATLLSTSISRFVVDLNRHPGDHEAAGIDPGDSGPPVSYGRRGLIWMETTRGETVVPRPLTAGELRERLRYYTPYHNQLAHLLDERRRRFGMSILIDAHSMPSRGARGHPDSGHDRADIVLGDNLGKACQAFVIEPVETVFRRAGLSVVRNQPYRGGYNTRFYGRPEQGVQALQIEINRKLYMNETTTTLLPEAASAVQTALDEAIRAVMALRE